MATIYIAIASRHDADQPMAAFSTQAAAQSYADRSNRLAKQRSPHPSATWTIHAVDLDSQQ
jgi:hypothetical protein